VGLEELFRLQREAGDDGLAGELAFMESRDKVSSPPQFRPALDLAGSRGSGCCAAGAQQRKDGSPADEPRRFG
jgi:hypothetical protein